MWRLPSLLDNESLEDLASIVLGLVSTRVFSPRFFLAIFQVGLLADYTKRCTPVFFRLIEVVSKSLMKELLLLIFHYRLHALLLLLYALSDTGPLYSLNTKKILSRFSAQQWGKRKNMILICVSPWLRTRYCRLYSFLASVHSWYPPASADAALQGFDCVKVLYERQSASR
jgi:hypothetical protein